MKNHILPAIRLTLGLLVILSILYPLFVAAVSPPALGGGDGVTIMARGGTAFRRVAGYENVGQKFTEDRYFSPSAVGYNAVAHSRQWVCALRPAAANSWR